MYYTDDQLDEIKLISDFDNMRKVKASYVPGHLSEFSHFYFKTIEEFEPIKDKVEGTTIYFSTCGLNLTENNDDLKLDNDTIIELSKRDVHFSIFDMYRMNIIGDYNHDENL